VGGMTNRGSSGIHHAEERAAAETMGRSIVPSNAAVKACRLSSRHCRSAWCTGFGNGVPMGGTPGRPSGRDRGERDGSRPQHIASKGFGCAAAAVFPDAVVGLERELAGLPTSDSSNRNRPS